MIHFDEHFSNGLVQPPTRYVEAASQIDAGGGRGGRLDDADDAIADDWNWNDEAQPSSPSLAIAAVRSVSQNDIVSGLLGSVAPFNARSLQFSVLLTA